MMVQPIIDDSLKYLGAGVQQRDWEIVTRTMSSSLALVYGHNHSIFPGRGKNAAGQGVIEDKGERIGDRKFQGLENLVADTVIA